jgi:hypothetical protein
MRPELPAEVDGRRNYNPMKDDDFDLTPKEFEELCREEASLRRRDKAILTLLRSAVRQRREQSRDLIKDERDRMRQRRKVAREELEQDRHDRRTQLLAKRSPEALAQLRASIATLAESTPEEFKADRIAEIAERKQQRLRRLNGSAL